MLIKEYRIPLPLSVEEYRIAQLYMIQKKSREESSGAGSGVEILVNEPYVDGPGGKGQYTHKIYHIGSHLPGWIKAILPKSALRVEEEAWNAYPYTKTIYRCPFIEKFVLEIETRYLSDGGETENVFNLSDSEMRNRLVDLLDIVRDPISSGDYKKEEDPTLFQSEKTKRGPLNENWLDEYKKVTKTKQTEKHVMCAYKLCKVEFRYWGMQSKVERFIHDIGLRKTMLRAHRQAWAWQDEYYGLQLSDIRRLEMETQAALAKKMEEAYEQEGLPQPKPVTNSANIEVTPEKDQTKADTHSSPKRQSVPNDTAQIKEDASHVTNAVGGRRRSWGSKHSFGSGSRQNLSDWKVESIEQLRAESSDEDEFFDAQEEMEKASNSSKSNPSLFRSSSMEMLSDSDFMDSLPPAKSSEQQDNEVFSSFDRRMEQMRQLNTGHSLDSALPAVTPNLSPPSTSSCRITVLFMVFHGGSILDTGHDKQATKHADISTLRATYESVVRAHYPAIHGHIAIRLVPCPYLCAETLHLLSSLNPLGFDAQSVQDSDVGNIVRESLPIGAISLFATSSPEYQEIVNRVVNRANSVYNEFLKSEEGSGFVGQVCMIGDCTGSIIGYDSLCQSHNASLSRNNSHYGSHEGLPEIEHTDSENDHHVFRKTNLETIKQLSISNPDLLDENPASKMLSPTDHSKPNQDSLVNNTQSKKQLQRTLSASYQKHLPVPPSSRRTSTGSQSDTGAKLDFEVSDFFMFGSPLALVLAYRRMNSGSLPRPSCHQIYNLFHPMDPSVARIEPLLCDRFRVVPPIKVPRYQKFPLGDGQSIHLVSAIHEYEEAFIDCIDDPDVETVQSNPDFFMDYGSSQSTSEYPPPLERRHSNLSITSQASGHGDLTINNITSVTRRWWGNKRVDYALYCPDALNNFPTSSLPYILHGSYWESTDVVSFILRQVVRQDVLTSQTGEVEHEVTEFTPGQPREKWLKRRTTIKLRNVAPNHRANDVLVVEDKPQMLSARFMYGPLDMVSLTGEKVDVHIMVNPPEGEWVYFGTETSDSNGKVMYQIPDDKRLSQGMYPVKMVVRGDHTSVDFFLTVLPPMTETVVFSVDGSFTASVSIMGKDPKVRPGAVDVVRHWQELGYLILYITARPDMQHKKVVAWLAQHNFPHGMVAFMEGVSANPLQQKANYLKTLKQEAGIKIHAAYGSSKDIAVYQSLNVDSRNLYIVGKSSKKHQKEAVVLQNGYASHLYDLTSHGGSRPAVGNARMFIRKSCFSLPGQKRHSGSKKAAARRTTSLPHKTNDSPANSHRIEVNKTGIVISESGNTVVDAGQVMYGKAMRARGTSPRPKISQV